MRNEFLDQSMWDVVFFNDYMYTGDQLKRSLKYRGHVEWLIREHAAEGKTGADGVFRDTFPLFAKPRFERTDPVYFARFS